MNGRRVYDDAACRRIDVLRFARQAGFTVAEIRTLFDGFSDRMPLGVRWRALARSKLAELDAQVASIQRMRDALAKGIRCGCLRVEDCVLAPPSRLPTTRASAPQGERKR